MGRSRQSGGWERELTEKERLFAEAYVGEAKGNAAEAARLAGICPGGNRRTVTEQAQRYLKRPRVQAYLRDLQENDPLVATRIERLQFLTRVLRGEEKDAKPTKDGLVDCEPSIKDRLAAAEALAKAAGEHVNKHEVKVTDDSVTLSTSELMKRIAELQAGQVPDETEADDDEPQEDA